MIETAITLASQYSSALRDYLARRDEADLQRAYELGRFALAEDVGILEMAVLYHDALGDALRGATAEEATETAKRGVSFFVESLSPFEMTHRGFRDSAIALRHLQERLEAEIRRIAHALHDEAGQLLASVHLALKEVESELSPIGRAHLGDVSVLLGEVESQLRRIAHELRPTALDDLGLMPALQFLAESVSMRTGITTTVDGSLEGALPLLVETAVYRIVQEALTNATRHAGAARVGIRLSREAQTLRCLIEDDGHGFDVAGALARRGSERGLGLAGIQERVAALGGTLRIESRPGAGTKLVLTIPVENNDVARHPARG